jgi:hypothetical protein
VAPLLLLHPFQQDSIDARQVTGALRLEHSVTDTDSLIALFIFHSRPMVLETT